VCPGSALRDFDYACGVAREERGRRHTHRYSRGGETPCGPTKLAGSRSSVAASKE